MSSSPSRLSFDARLFLLAVGAGFPGTLASLLLVWTHGYHSKVQWTVTVVVVCSWVGFSLAVREHLVRGLQTVSNLLAALREGDFSIRGRTPTGTDAMSSALAEINTLGQTLRQQRLGAVEATALRQKVMQEIEVAVMAFDGASRLQLINPAAERLLAQPADRLLTRSAAELSLTTLLEGPVPRTIEATFPGTTGQWELRRTAFRQEGHPHQLVVLSDVHRALREEERLAWKRLIRVLGHEINNSLAPITSIAGNLRGLLAVDPPPTDWRDDIARGLSVIERRGEALGRFMEGYARLARLPPPRHQPIEVEAWVNRISQLYQRRLVSCQGPPVLLQGDADQLDQLLINLLRNATEAADETNGKVQVEWAVRNGLFDLTILDEGPGISETSNLFVPFFTTKKTGSGIGLVLSRQIAEAHEGELTLSNRDDRRGCVAHIQLPLVPSTAATR